MNTSTKQTENLAECGNKSKPLLQAVFLQNYISYGLKGRVEWKHKNKIHSVELYGILPNDLQIENPYGGFDYCSYEDFKPILKPFSDYAEILEITDEMNDYEIQMIEDSPDLIKRLPFDVIEKMFKNHIDVFGLINFGLAVSVHDVV